MALQGRYLYIVIHLLTQLHNISFFHTDVVLFVMKERFIEAVIYEYLQSHAAPSSNNFTELVEFKNTFPAKYSLNQSPIEDAFLAAVASAYLSRIELSPVCAIVGGVAAQVIIALPIIDFYCLIFILGSFKGTVPQ